MSLSIWLSSSRHHSQYQKLSKIVRNHNKHYFEPHITLISLQNVSKENIEEIIELTKEIASSNRRFTLKNNGVKTGTSYFQSVMLEMQKEEPLMNIRSQSISKFERFLPNQTPEYYPHASLFYGTHNPTIVKSIEKAIEDSNITNLDFPIDTLNLYLTNDSVDEWIHLGSAPLGEKNFFRSGLFINNEWRRPSDWIPVENPATKEVFHHIPRGTSSDIDEAVKAAKTAFPSWSKLSGRERAGYLKAIAAELEKRQNEFATLDVLDNGKPLEEALGDVQDTISCFLYYAQQAIELDGKQNQEISLPDPDYKSHVRYEPVGVAALIVPWNYPLLMATWKLAPCLAAGCTAVLKPSEWTSLSALALGSIWEKVGLPKGVVNVVTGYGKEAGEALTHHPDVAKIAFTGSIPTGSHVMGVASLDIKRVSLELGGKSPFVIFDDSDVEQAVEWIMFGIFFNQGQVCSATSRVLIQESLYDKVVSRLIEETQKLVIGDGLHPSTKVGPLVSQAQYEKVLHFIEKGIAEGAQLLCGGLPVKEELLKGYFVPPTIFGQVSDSMTIWKEEIFGPVVCVTSFKDEDEALRRANDTSYGLAAAVMSRDEERCSRVAENLEAGIVWVNCSQPTFVEAPWGGKKRSGVGRELGPWGLQNYLEVKQITRYTSKSGLGFQWYLKSKE